MKKFKQLGIWMDDTNALLMEFYNHIIVSKSIVFKPDIAENNEDPQEVQSDEVVSNPYQKAFFKEISDIISNYQEVLLFGPTDSKYDLWNYLKSGHKFREIKFELKNTDKMNEEEMHEFVIEYFR